MTVEELIKELQQLDQSATVLVGGTPCTAQDNFKIENRHALHYFPIDEWEILHPADAEHWLQDPEIDEHEEEIIPTVWIR